jgi:serine/threonine protein phosphatase 1
LFVHAGFNEGNPDVFSDKSAMLWSRKEEYCSEFFRDKIIIHGHTPINKETLNFSVQKKSNVLNIDTGCVYSTDSMPRTLSSIELPSMKVFSINNIDISKLPLSL